MEAENKKKYWDGKSNKAIRYYFYAKRGLALLNEFRYLIMAIFALYYTLRLSNPIYLILMFCVSLPVLIGFGYLCVHHMAKVIEFLNVEFSTHFRRYQIQLQEKTLKVLEKIADEK